MRGLKTGATALILAMSCAENIALLLDMGAAINDRDEVSGEGALTLWLYLLYLLPRYVGGRGGCD